MDDDGTHIEGWRKVYRHRDSQGHLEGLHVNREQSAMNYYCPI